MRGVLWYLLRVAVVVAVVAVITMAVVYSGWDSVSATYPDRRAVAWFLDTTMTRSVTHHARGIRVPPLDDQTMARTGFQQYRAACVECHAGPGVPPKDLAQGLNPTPPPLADSAGDWKPNELFWLAKNGVRMSGMPAWAPTRSDEQLWAIVAFLQRLPKLTEAEYQTMDRQVPPLPRERAHSG
jgi:mono/diheme cytochrome c family protein